MRKNEQLIPYIQRDETTPLKKEARKKKKKKKQASPSVPHHGGEENLVSLDILLSNPPFSPPSEVFSKLTPTFLFIRAENPTCAAFLISCGHIKGYCTQAQTLSENGDWQLRAKAGTKTLEGIYISGNAVAVLQIEKSFLSFATSFITERMINHGW